MGHQHTTAPRGAERHKGSLISAFALLAAAMVAEFLTALHTGSLALLSDAGHAFTDVLGIGMALAAIQAASASRGRRGVQRTFGLYRLEVLAALANAVLLLAVSGYVVVEAARRLGDPPPVLAGPMLAVASIGLVANVIAFGLLRRGAAESLNVRGAYLEVLADILGSVGVIVAAGILWLTDWRYADPLVAVVFGALILPRALKLAAAAIRILVQAAPEHLDVAEIDAALRAVPDVIDVHDLHVWTLTSGMDVASAHLTVRSDATPSEVLAAAQAALQDKYGIDHATLQIEPAGAPVAQCDKVGW
ncbi:MAG: cation diffusion facilitator family transporter [Micromonosporaceae bacterium]